MGRYYTGDIEGKFWFAVQPSDAANRFGVIGEKSKLSYYFSSDELPEIEKELERIKKGLGTKKEKLDKFFAKHCGYTDDELMKYLCVKDKDKLKEILREYADFELGTQIAECVKENDYCWFEAEQI